MLNINENQEEKIINLKKVASNVCSSMIGNLDILKSILNETESIDKAIHFTMMIQNMKKVFLKLFYEIYFFFKVIINS